jgi:signal-transduction protein with cAMP-binding, CBS, and nucleotidyltransferase domain
MAQRMTYASAEWPLEKAADEMVRGRFRHVVVLDGSEVVGILSMRDIVRCWNEARSLRRSTGTSRENSMGHTAAI